MTTPAPQPFDPANQLLSETPAQLNIAVMDTPAGQRLVMTVRTASTTVTVLLQGADAKSWAAQMTRAATAMSGTGLVVAGNGHMPPVAP